MRLSSSNISFSVFTFGRLPTYSLQFWPSSLAVEMLSERFVIAILSRGVINLSVVDDTMRA
jgi:hypothetical protein